MEGLDFAERAVYLTGQIGVILLVAKLFGEIFERYFHQSPVLGNLIGGAIIGPFALGQFFRLPGMNEPLFALANGQSSAIPLSPELWGIAQLAVVLLLFLSGLHTDLHLLSKFSLPAFAVAVGGIVLPFIFGIFLTMVFGYADSIMHPSSLFMGAVMAATSVGITAKLLSEVGKLSIPEGITILVAAVIDDVLGIIILTIIVSMIEFGEVAGLRLAVLSVKAFGFWLALTFTSIIFAPALGRLLRWFQTEGAFLGLALAVCFIVSALTESFGKLTMIIGAYALGLGLSRTEVSDDLKQTIQPISYLLSPIFFVAMGMLVDFKTMGQAALFGIAISSFAIIGKVLGCGGMAFLTGFNKLGAVRIGFGMMARGEVALIVAGIGMAHKVINAEEFGATIMMTFITTFLAPIILIPLFKKPHHGLKRRINSNPSI